VLVEARNSGVSKLAYEIYAYKEYWDEEFKSKYNSNPNFPYEFAASFFEGGENFHHGVPVFYQDEGQPWSDRPFPKDVYPDGTVATSACSIIAMVMAMYKVAGYASIFDALDFVYGRGKYEGREDYRSDQALGVGVDIDFFIDYANRFNIETQKVGKDDFINSEDKIIKALENGASIVIKMGDGNSGASRLFTKSAHYVAIIGYKKTLEGIKYIVHDPNSRETESEGGDYPDLFGAGSNQTRLKEGFTYTDLKDHQLTTYIFDPTYSSGNNK
jgi:hypothetical protein